MKFLGIIKQQFAIFTLCVQNVEVLSVALSAVCEDHDFLFSI